MSWIISAILILIGLWIALYFYFTRKFNHWKNKNVPYIPPVPFFGNAFKVFTLRENIGQMCYNIHSSTTKPFVGFFICDEPYLLIRDPELIKTVLVKDFDVFDNRSVHDNKTDDPMGSHLLFVLKTPDWTSMRRKLTPAFTSGKMKFMFRLVHEAGVDMIKYLEEKLVNNSEIDVRDLSSRYATDTITSTAFGINANCFKDENAEFRSVSRRVFNWSIWERAISTSCYFLAPNLVKWFKLKFIDSASADFLRNAFWKIMNEREQKGLVRNDMLDILIEIRKQENIDDPCKLEGDKLVAQATQFFVGGYETTSTVITLTLYELAVNRNIQNRLRREVKEISQKYNGGITYDSLKEMEYLNMCIKETLRKYPVLPFLDRRCNRDYQIPNTDVILERGSSIFVSIWRLHYDPEYFPYPEKYDPLRFTQENVKARPPHIYLPFGEGPRKCIGDRFGTVSSKSAVALIVSNFEIDLCTKTQHPIKMDPRGFLLAPYSNVLLNFKKL